MTVFVLVSTTFAVGSSQVVFLQGVSSATSLPRFGHGYAVSWSMDFRNVTLNGPDGSILWTRAISLPGVDRAIVRDAAICPAGRVVLSTTLVSMSHAVTAATVRLAPDGTVEKVVQTHPYAPRRLACTESGRLWSAGRSTDAEFRGESAGYAVVRRYSQAGVEDLSLLPRSETGGPNSPHPASSAYLRADEQGFALLSISTSRLYLGNNQDVSVRSVPFIAPPGCSEVNGAALLKSSIVISCVNHAGPDGKRSESTMAVLDRSSGAVLKPPLPLAEPAAVLGSEGDQVVLFGSRGRSLFRITP